MNHDQGAQILNRLFPGIEARSGYIGNCSPCGTHDDRAFRIFTKIDIRNPIWGTRETLSINVAAGEATAMTDAQCALQILRCDNRQRVSPAVAQVLNAVRYAA